VETQIPEFESRVTSTKTGIREWEKVREGRGNHLAEVEGKIQEAKSQGLTSEDPQLAVLLEERDRCEALCGGPDSVMMSLQSDLAHELDALEYWKSRLRKIEFLEKQAAQKTKGGKKP
jgi:hypothetical protein